MNESPLSIDAALANLLAAAFSVPAGFDWPSNGKSAGKRRGFPRARLENGWAMFYPSQSSGVLTSLPGPMAWSMSKPGPASRMAIWCAFCSCRSC